MAPENFSCRRRNRKGGVVLVGFKRRSFASSLPLPFFSVLIAPLPLIAAISYENQKILLFLPSSILHPPSQSSTKRRATIPATWSSLNLYRLYLLPRCSTGFPDYSKMLSKTEKGEYVFKQLYQLKNGELKSKTCVDQRAQHRYNHNIRCCQ